MRRFNFRLQRVMEIREMKEKDCQRELARSMEVLNREERQLQNIAGEFQASREGLRRALMKKCTAGLLNSLNGWRNRQEDELKVQTAHTNEQKGRVDQKRSALVTASKKKKVLERLRERRLEEHQTESQQEEQAFLDELGCRIGRSWKRPNEDPGEKE